MSDEVICKLEGRVARVMINRPEQHNAMNLAVWRGLLHAFQDLNQRSDLRCVVIRGTGGKAFSPGADIKEFETERSSPALAKVYGAVMHETLAQIRDCQHPVVAMIEGPCVGAGLEIACCCDLRICQTKSRFGVPVNRLGLVMAYQEMEGLLALVGQAVALEIVLEGRVFGSAEAKEKGLVNRIVADDAIEAETDAMVRRIVAGAPLVNRWHKRFVRTLMQKSVRDLSEAELDEGFACFKTEDFQIGYQSFLTKTKPEFIGK